MTYNEQLEYRLIGPYGPISEWRTICADELGKFCITTSGNISHIECQYYDLRRNGETGSGSEK